MNTVRYICLANIKKFYDAILVGYLENVVIDFLMYLNTFKLKNKLKQLENGTKNAGYILVI
jgi:hypothetical protein